MKGFVIQLKQNDKRLRIKWLYDQLEKAVKRVNAKRIRQYLQREED